MKTLITGAKVYLQGGFQKRDVAIADGRIREVSLSISPKGFDLVEKAEDRYLVPGFADVHVHLREPGFSYKETIATGTRAGARGGYTALCAMPNLNPPPDTPEHLEEELALIRRDAAVRVYPYGTITLGQKGAGELTDMEALAQAGAVAFSDDGKGIQEAGLMRRAMKRAAALGKMIVAHCEVDALLGGGCIHDGVYAAAHGYRGISSRSEWEQVERDLALAEETGCRYHVCHVSTRESVELIRAAKARGVRVTCETGPHYLTLCDEDMEEDGRFKMNPPLRSAADRQALVEGLQDGTIDVIATDHAPHSAEEKARGLEKSPMGVVGLETAFPVLYTRLVLTGVLTLEELVYRMAVRPREIFRLPGGVIEAGAPADLALLELGEEYTVDPGDFLSKGRSTPFAGWQVRGQIVLTMVGGRPVWRKEEQ